MLLGIKVVVPVAVFHPVWFGHCEVRLENGGKAVMEQVKWRFISVDAHRVAQGQKSKTLPVEALLKVARIYFTPQVRAGKVKVERAT